MSEAQDRQPATPALSAVLPENVRQQYLGAMGIQTWYDPTLDVSPAENIQAERKSSIVLDEQIKETELIQPAQLEQACRESSVNSLGVLSDVIGRCQLCELHTARKQAIGGEGNAEAELMVITDAPVDGALFTAENQTMLQRMLQAINIDLSDVYITTLVKCQPPEQRAPFTSEMICCDEYLSAQIKLIQPKIILVLGERASQQLLVSQKSLADLRLRQYQHMGVPVYASCHPHELFGCAETKRKVWQDMLQIKKCLN